MAKEYIEREAATAYAPLPKHLREYQTMNLDDAWEDGYDFAIRQLNSIPAADVRPVVRCKDCVYHYYAVDCAGMCELGIGSALLDDDFCSRGTRKSGAKMDGGQDDA